MNRTNKKTSTKFGNQTDIYKAGEHITCKWNKRWLITKVTYNPDKNVTYVRLEKEE